MKLGKLAPKVQTIDLRHAKALDLPENYGKGRGGRPWRRIVARILKRDQYTCQESGCGVVDHKCEVDHKVPQSQGGSDDDSNLQALCPPCHKLKTAREAAAGRMRDGGVPRA